MPETIRPRRLVATIRLSMIFCTSSTSHCLMQEDSYSGDRGDSNPFTCVHSAVPQPVWLRPQCNEEESNPCLRLATAILPLNLSLRLTPCVNSDQCEPDFDVLECLGLVDPLGLEPSTSCLQSRRSSRVSYGPKMSTIPVLSSFGTYVKWRRRDSNPRLPACHAGTLTN